MRRKISRSRRRRSGKSDGVGEDCRGREWRSVEGQPRTWRREAILDHLEGTFGHLGDLPGLSSKASGASWTLRRATVGCLGAVFETLPATPGVLRIFRSSQERSSGSLSAL